MPAELPNPQTTVINDVANPDETKPTEEMYSRYVVEPNDPRAIAIKDLGIYGLVQKVGLTENNQIAVPTNIHFAGWYVNSAIPGEKGLSIIDGHVSGATSDGIFKKLVNAKIDQEVMIEFGDKTTKKFKIVEVKTVAESQAATELFNQNYNIDNQLNLITCTGKFNKNTQTYEDRVVAVTQLVE